MNPFEQLLSALDQAGLWRHASADDATSARSELLERQAASWTGGGAWWVDGEDLAEGYVEQWLRAMAAPLRDCGVELQVATATSPHDEASTGYAIVINGTGLPLFLYDPAEPMTPTSDDPWTDCQVLPAARVNDLLQSAESQCRLVIFWPGGNDGFAVLGPESVLRQVMASGPAERPWDDAIQP